MYLTIRKTQVKNNIKESSLQTNGSTEIVQPEKEAFEKQNKFMKNRASELQEKLTSFYDNTWNRKLLHLRLKLRRFLKR